MPMNNLPAIKNRIPKQPPALAIHFLRSRTRAAGTRRKRDFRRRARFLQSQGEGRSETEV